jgi:hypothetical protein
MWKKVNLAEKKIWRRWPANAARFFQTRRKSEKSLSVHKSGLAKLIRGRANFLLKGVKGECYGTVMISDKKIYDFIFFFFLIPAEYR